MARRDRLFVCQSCGAVHPRWAGRCNSCGGWNSIVEETPASAVPGAAGAVANARRGRRLEVVELDLATAPPPRLRTGIAELDRVLGGGIVPGVGSCCSAATPASASRRCCSPRWTALAAPGSPCSTSPARSRCGRRSCRGRAAGAWSGRKRPRSSPRSTATRCSPRPRATASRRVLAVDSIQTLFLPGAGERARLHRPGARAAPARLMALRRSVRATPTFLVGHVTKDGAIAGPRVLEHMVDTVLYFEGERGHRFRILRAVKNRFGSTNEIGVFEMKGAGLVEVADPSALFLAERPRASRGRWSSPASTARGRCWSRCRHSSRPPSYGTPRRAVVGWDPNRLAMLLAGSGPSPRRGAAHAHGRRRAGGPLDQDGPRALDAGEDRAAPGAELSAVSARKRRGVGDLGQAPVTISNTPISFAARERF